MLRVSPNVEGKSLAPIRKYTITWVFDKYLSVVFLFKKQNTTKLSGFSNQINNHNFIKRLFDYFSYVNILRRCGLKKLCIIPLD